MKNEEETESQSRDGEGERGAERSKRGLGKRSTVFQNAQSLISLSWAGHWGLRPVCGKQMTRGPCKIQCHRQVSRMTPMTRILGYDLLIDYGWNLQIGWDITPVIRNVI